MIQERGFVRRGSSSASVTATSRHDFQSEQSIVHQIVRASAGGIEIAEARRAREERAAGYREQALKIYPWTCGRCGRAFAHANLQLLELHHRDHNRDKNPPIEALGAPMHILSRE